ncbi:aromatic prenyltransferase [Streptomyces sp. NPDC050523]|uniref:aromatic prenyltransferase n=1 Tax=Streptomyces sp. NPDC050523 TaxID=3365622 RepID=UPI0037A4ED74
MMFSTEQLIEDVLKTAKGLEAPCCEPVSRKVVETFSDCFADGATVWKTTGRPHDHLYYRFFARTSTDTISTAFDAKLLERETTATRLIRSWSGMRGARVTQSCDFDAFNGLAKTWLYLGGMRPADEVLDRPFVPDGLRRQLGTFRTAGLGFIRFMAVDHRHETVNLYFRASGPIDATCCAPILDLVQVPVPEPELLADIRRFVPEDFCVAVTVSLGTGKPQRACFYALKLPPGRFPCIPERITRFFREAPCYDADTVNVVGWSFGAEGGTYIKAEKSYTGDMVGLLTDWDCYFSGSTQRDPVLAKQAQTTSSGS